MHADRDAVPAARAQRGRDVDAEHLRPADAAAARAAAESRRRRRRRLLLRFAVAGLAAAAAAWRALAARAALVRLEENASPRPSPIAAW